MFFFLLTVVPSVSRLWLGGCNFSKTLFYTRAAHVFGKKKSVTIPSTEGGNKGTRKSSIGLTYIVTWDPNGLLCIGLEKASRIDHRQHVLVSWYFEIADLEHGDVAEA